MRVLFFCLAACGILFFSCKEEPHTLFRLLPASETGVDFANNIFETDSFNILTFEYIYNGGGVAIADFNGDGLQDIFFTGNQVANRLYLNKGDLRFTDVTETANVNINDRWNTGVAVADINNDGLPDIYVCAAMYPDSTARANMLFINKGPNEHGVPIFKNEAAEYGVADTGHSMNAAFFDYDNDGDLDLYVLTNQQLKSTPSNYRPKMRDGSSPNTDRLYRNNGDGTFTNVSAQAGILIEGFGLGLSIVDIDDDGWQDIYVSNDFISNDILYVNQHDGTFKNEITQYIGHQSQFSMGNDAADINNDGLPDLMTLDMLPESNSRIKTTVGGTSYLTYIDNEKYNYEYQYMRNMLHVNNGKAGERAVRFSEVGFLGGVYQTEWSWSPLFADFDNDGYKDLIITNGFPKDITDKDFANYRTGVGRIASPSFLIDSIPVVKVSNYAFRNNDGITFTNTTEEWGMNHPSFSNGAAFADLDNDGDLDYIVNNISDPAFLYENTLYNGDNPDAAHYLRLKLKAGESLVQGTRVDIHYGSGKRQTQVYSVYRGYMSTVEDVIHFGLGDAAGVDTVFIHWPDGTDQILNDVSANQVVEVSYQANQSIPDDVRQTLPTVQRKSQPEFKEVAGDVGIAFVHHEEDKIDYNIQRTLPHKFSQLGPGLAVGDVNGDGLEDFYVTGSSGVPGYLFVQTARGQFMKPQPLPATGKKTEEEENALFFDADGDGDLDLYVVSGSFEFRPGSEAYQDKLYLNNGRGQFTLTPSALPEMAVSGSCVRAADFDRDGDLDLFVAGRVIPAGYPYAPRSSLLRNDGGKFVDVTSEVCPGLEKIGMVTDALWSDFDGDGLMDLVLAREFGSLVFVENSGTQLTPLDSTGIENASGWWNSVVAGDFDEDGDVDYIAGNLGLNNYYHPTAVHPLKVFAKDFDNNGSVDAILGCYLKSNTGDMQLYPVHAWDQLSSQSPRFRQQFLKYKDYAKVTMTDLLSPEDLSGALILETNHTASGFVENLGGGRFKLHDLPVEVQVAPVNGMVVEDFDGDGHLDVAMIGNDYGNEIFSGRYDAFTGQLLLGDGKGGFAPVPSSRSGFLVAGDGKALVKLYGAKGGRILLASQNRDSLKVYLSKPLPDFQMVNVQSTDVNVTYRDQQDMIHKIECYYGSGYLSQSSRRISIPRTAKEITITDSRGNKRTVGLMP